MRVMSAHVLWSLRQLDAQGMRNKVNRYVQAELMEMVAKDEVKEPKKGKRKTKKKNGKSDGKAELLLCGCGAACDVCERCSQRSKSPLRQPPNLQDPAKGSPVRAGPEEGESPPRQQAQMQNKRAVTSPSRSTLGAELVSTPRPSSPFQVQQLASSHSAFFGL